MLRAFVTAAALATSALVAAPAAHAEGDAEAGKRVYQRQCLRCHVIQEGQQRIGPSLYGVVGREAGSVDGYLPRYSQALKDATFTWDEEKIAHYISEKDFLDGNRMWQLGYRGGLSEQDVQDVIAYIKANGGMAE
ncbi:hypothetical protein CCR85_04625 [Rhodothalassium salexigens]|uniref:c-type cytochrome n=1 Tax=Rhodothalassium salexigens TaxID=1086 RepID=UPI0019144329|nr:c-type cytochrome [Rhodothalassium salexigens]MBK5910777.1 hypothetical protein [Rhodothalassium salexigens]MBK5920523.1 hypothetical protein [Rhodothalassium salexigens]